MLLTQFSLTVEMVVKRWSLTALKGPDSAVVYPRQHQQYQCFLFELERFINAIDAGYNGRYQPV